MSHEPGYYYIPFSKQLFFCDGDCESSITWVEIADFTTCKSQMWCHEKLLNNYRVEYDMVLYVKLTGKLPDELS